MSSAIGGPLIALVNDDPRFLELASGMLDRHGFRAALYAFRDETYADLRADHPRLVVVSLTAPRPAAWQLLSLLRLDPATAAIPLLLCSPDVRLLAEKSKWLGAMRCDLLEEPFNEQQLLTKIQSRFSRLLLWDHDG